MSESMNVPKPQLVGTEPRDFIGRWQQAWVKGFKQAQVNRPGDEPEQRACAEREANRLYDVDMPENYEQAMALEPWQVQFRGQVGGQFCVVLNDTRKKYFPLPKALGGARGGAKDKE